MLSWFSLKNQFAIVLPLLSKLQAPWSIIQP